MVPQDDWRRQGQEQYLAGAVLVRRPYRQYAKNPKWDHDHCEFCGATFSLFGSADTLTEGYATEDDYRWICPTCFNDFQEEFGWRVGCAERRLSPVQTGLAWAMASLLLHAACAASGNAWSTGSRFLVGIHSVIFFVVSFPGPHLMWVYDTLWNANVWDDPRPFWLYLYFIPGPVFWGVAATLVCVWRRRGIHARQRGNDARKKGVENGR